jgi:hypothetical protein
MGNTDMGFVHFIKSFPLNPLDFYRAFIKYNPYSFKELLGCYIRNSFGPSYKNKGIVDNSPKHLLLNENVTTKFRIAIIGDIMDMAGRNEKISNNVKRFVEDCDYLIGNFEATITNTNRNYILAQRHSSQILDALADFFTPDKTFLNLANNHAGDFGYEVFSKSKAKLESRGFKIIGTSKKPFADIESHIRIIAGTTISNIECDYIAKLDDAINNYSADKFNLLYPHWGHDLELFPRPDTVALAKNLIQKFDAIIGHHAHVPQPVTTINSDETKSDAKRLIAYGLGDFCIWEELKHYLYGVVIKLEIGPDIKNQMKISQVKWRYTICREVNNREWETDLVDEFPYQ